jgi:methylenetetrahydrofolate dehydrogenase (NADP+)/methenyltetrahydrofolate cyclohydrolase
MQDTIIIKGKEIAEGILNDLAEEVKNLPSAPCLAVVLVGENPASMIYVRNKIKKCALTGIESKLFALPAETTEKELEDLVKTLSEDKNYHGILVQLPLPEHINEQKIIAAVSPEKDVDGFTPVNIGRLALKQDCLMPCTPLGCITLLKTVKEDLAGLNAVVIGRSNIVGKPLAQMLLNQNCTVTICHSYTQNLPDICRKADILVAACGKPYMVKGDWIKQGAIVLDVGISYLADKTIKGDVDFEQALGVAAAITPVPKGVGPMTIAMLLKNTVKAYRKQKNL